MSISVEILEQFEQALQQQDKSQATIRGYMADVRRYIAWFEQTYKQPWQPGNIIVDDVLAYKRHLAAHHLKPAAVNRRLAALSSFCKWAVETSVLNDNPTSGVSGSKSVRTPPRALSTADLRRLVRHAKQGRPLDAAVVVLLANTGLRPCEVCDLVLGDVEINERSGKVIVRSGKGDKYREVPLNAEARRHLAQYIESRTGPVDDDYLFIGQRGERLTTSGLWRIVNKYAGLAGVKVSPVVLRHTFATRLVRDGVDLATVAELMGHESVDTTLIYTRPNEDDRRAAVEGLV